LKSPGFRTGTEKIKSENAMHFPDLPQAIETAKRDLHAADPGQPVVPRKELDELFSHAYEELRRLASSVRRYDPSATLSPTALVNEAWIKLARSPDVGAESRLHFKRIAARAMRQLLVEAARRRNADKRGGEEAVYVTFDEALTHRAACGKELIALDAALEELARANPRQAVMVESRFFGGLDLAETAALLGVSEATVLRDWRAAKAWLARALRSASPIAR
jgi:RNA polymerase sigma factor (TIGR02999 family)